MIMNNNQKRQLILAGCFVVLMILWLFVPGWRAAKILGIIANALLLLSMLVSYRAEERMKKKDKSSGCILPSNTFRSISFFLFLDEEGFLRIF